MAKAQTTTPIAITLPSAVAKRFPKSLSLRNGEQMTLRLMTRADRDAVVNFARSLPPNDLLFLRSNITEPAAVDRWVDNIEAGRSLTILAYAGDALAGYASLHLNEADWMRHIAEIRMLTGPAHRGVGLGRILAGEAYAVGSGLGLKKLSAQMTLDQGGARRTFERLGFKAEALLGDWVMSSDGQTRDLLVMAYDLAGLTDMVDA